MGIRTDRQSVWLEEENSVGRWADSKEVKLESWME